MWKLRNVKKEHLEQYILVGEECVVGRKDASLLITTDPSVSRKHAVLYVIHPEGNLVDAAKKSSLFLRDEGSKYGTFHNGQRVKGQVQLKGGDTVKFGQFESEYRVHETSLIVTTSCLGPAAKRELRTALRRLGGHLVTEWQPVCSHLVMDEVKVTVKALCCLVSAKPIVKPEYFQELEKNLKSSAAFLSPDSFVPPIGEALIDKDVVSFGVNAQRKKLFENKTFFFMDEKQYKKLHLGILLGGGNASLLSNPELLRGDFCLIEPPASTSQSQISLFQKATDIINKNNLRMIPESDIGLAVTYCSTEKYCNPKFQMGNALMRSQRIQSMTLTEREVYVPDTQNSLRPEQRSAVARDLNCLDLSSLPAEELVEEMDVSQVPLSATVKRELDVLFDDDDDDEVEPVSILSPPKRKRDTPSSPRSNTLVPKRQMSPAPKENTSSSSDMQTVIGRKCTPSSPKRKPKTEPDTTKKIEVKTENCLSPPPLTNGHVAVEEELPRNLVKVQVVSLVYRKPASVPAPRQYAGIKNFKKFKKVQSKYGRALPRIIGGYQLVPFDRLAAQLCDPTMENDHPLADEASQPMKGEFDWDTSNV